MIFGQTRFDSGHGWALTVFADGVVLPAAPHETAEYAALAVKLGYGGNWGRMCTDHDLLHNWLAHALGKPHSPALRAAADGAAGDPRHGLEEDAVLAIQRLAMAWGLNLAETLRP